MADTKVIWKQSDHDDDEIVIYTHNLCSDWDCVASIKASDSRQPVHLTREALADLVRAAAPLAGLKVIPQEYEYTELKPAEPDPEVDGEPGLDPEDRAAAVAAVWGGRCKGESTGWLWGSTVDVAHYIATGEVPA